ncbi:serine/threonine protein kinase [Streptomyces montanus]|uniref:non-specific serine/threonine protein kinase n=1 Tax=Streptomyces montanus TaxID=2580423 RepID=A0A5R9FN60_9ACTN|nr:serine/threonine-protein kinase [Streptomyces montanus]TLS43380.1 serine/threonine protein kinase [Streptomyces montanus]
MNAPGDLIDGRFELVEPLGSGGMGTVWRARDTVLHREVALKAVRAEAASSDAMRERVLREARALARLSDPHVVTIHHIVDEDPHPWLVMELVPGTSLQDRLDTGPLSPAEAAHIGRQVLAALRAADAAGIQHRDVKPANILLRPDGTAVLTDFGIAALQGSTSLTATGELIGSPEYIAPERIRGTDDDPASDLWSLGLVLYVCVEGVSPLRRGTTLATLAAILDDPVPPPVRSGPLAPVLQALLVRDPAARPDAARLDAMLAQAEAGTTPHWTQPTLITPTPLDHAAPAEPAPPAPTPAPAPPHTPTQLDTPRPAPHPPGDRPRRRMPIVIAVVAVALVVTAATTLILALGDKADSKADRPAASTSSAPAASPTSPTPTPTPSPTQATTRPPTSPPAPAPTPQGRWIAQLYSEPVGAGTAARDQRLARIRESVPGARFLRSDDFASLRPGFWVFYAPGPFPNGRAALKFCRDRGRTSANLCIGRYLSKDAADFGLQCRPPAANPTGRCTRP